MNVTFNRSSYMPGDAVEASAVAFASISVTSELAQATSTVDAGAPATVPLGVAAVGSFAVHLDSGGDVYAAVLSFLPDGAGGLELVVVAATAAARLAAVNSPLLQRFEAGLTSDRVHAALDDVWPDWIASNAVAIGGTAVVCLVPGFQLQCGLATVASVVDLAAAVVRRAVERMQQDGLLTSDEADEVKLALGVGNLVVQTAVGGDEIDRLIAAGSGIVDLAVNEPQATIGVKLAADLARKHYFVWTVLKDL